MVKKNHSTSFYLVGAFFVASIIFSSGIGIGIMFDSFKTDSINENIQTMTNSLKDAEVELLVMDYLGGNLSCQYLTIKSYELSDLSAELGTELDLFEQSNQINKDVYIPLKEQYTRVLIKNWITLEEIKTSCTANYSTILYFYNNDFCELCDNQAYILQYYKGLLKDDVMIFAIDTGLNSSVVDLLRYNYGVIEYPSLVIDGKLYSGFQDSNFLNQILI